jgi:uncharacterized RDD family membrane protein YckC
MKCPKCGYLGFEDVDRCRNCGYEFSLALSAAAPDLTLRRKTDSIRPLDDITLIDAAAMPAAASSHDPEPEIDRVFSASRASVATRESEELPLFSGPADDTPLITRASPPRPPLSVRRATPEVPRLRSQQPRLQSFDVDVDEPEIEQEPDIVSPAARAGVIAQWPQPRPERPEAASVVARFIAVVIDLVVLAAVDAVVIYFTMQICGLTLEEAGLLPKGPLLAFLLVQNGGFLTAFTAGGQTLGKMATGIRVVATESAGHLDFGRAATRTMVWLVLAIPAGLGFLTLFSRDHRGLHDRFAGTRVVRASA